MKVVDDFPHGVREMEHVWIPMSDGCRLAARIWLPDGAERFPVPAIIEYIPYGKRIGTRDRDEAMHGWFAGHGLAALRIDSRGSGESEGLLVDEYLPQEQVDGVEAIRWVAAQPWCTGAVGLIGKSWGGFNALQVAARRPPELRGIVTVCSTDDRYADDVHYMGGCLLNDNLWWGATFFQLVAQPPDPELVGSSWRATWLERLEAAEPHPLRWLRHPLADEYWKQGSVRQDYGGIACPVFAVGGWADGYASAIPRLLSGLRVPRRGLVGPWGHAYPHDASPGPSIGFLQEALRWWHGCLGDGKGDPPQLPPSKSEPLYRVWMGETVPDGFPRGGDRPGRWVAPKMPACVPSLLRSRRARRSGCRSPRAATTDKWKPIPLPMIASFARGPASTSAVAWRSRVFRPPGTSKAATLPSPSSESIPTIPCVRRPRCPSEPSWDVARGASPSRPRSRSRARRPSSSSLRGSTPGRRRPRVPPRLGRTGAAPRPLIAAWTK